MELCVKINMERKRVMDKRKKVFELIVCLIVFIFAVCYCVYLAKKPETHNDAWGTNGAVSTQEPLSTEGITWDIQN